MTAKRRARWLNAMLIGASVAAVLVTNCSRTPPHEDVGVSPGSILGSSFSATPAFAQQRIGGATIADVAERVVPSVVNLSATRRVDPEETEHPMLKDPALREFLAPHGLPDRPGDREARSLGSGVLVGAEGIVLTSAHMVDKADQVEITLHDGREVDGTVVGADMHSDLAVVRIKDKVDGLVPLPIGDSNGLRLGEVVLAVGNPFGVGQTVSMGIVSAVGRSSMGIVDFEDFIQTDAAINPGSSGGALVNMRGELVGINTAILSRSGGSMGIGFAIPSAMATPIMKSLLQHGKVIRGQLGVAIQDVDRDLAEALKLPERAGVLVSDVNAGSPAAAAGLARGDVIRAVNGKPTQSASRFRNHVASLGPGTELELDVLRDGRTRTVSVRLGAMRDAEQEGAPAEPPGAAAEGRPAAASPGLLEGVDVAELTPPIRRTLEVPAGVRGVVVTQVEPGGRADLLGLQPGDVVMEVNRQPTASVQDFHRKARASGQRAVLLVCREGATAFMASRQ